MLHLAKCGVFLFQLPNKFHRSVNPFHCKILIWIWKICQFEFESPRKYSHSPAKALFKTLLLKVPPAESLGWPGFEDGNQYRTMKICWKVSNSPLWWAAVGHQITWVPCTCFQYPYCATACGKTMVYNPNLKLFCEMKSIFFEWENYLASPVFPSRVSHGHHSLHAPVLPHLGQPLLNCKSYSVVVLRIDSISCMLYFIKI